MKKLKRILFVDDDENDIELAMTALEEARLANRVDVCRDGVEAMDYLHARGDYAKQTNELPLVMFLDLMMPRMDGIEVLREVRADPHLKALPIVMLSSAGEERDLIDSYELGVNAYVVKPVDFENFVQAVKDLGMFWAVYNEPPPQLNRQSSESED